MQGVTKVSGFTGFLVLTLAILAVSPCFGGEKQFKEQGRQTIEQFKKTDPSMKKFFSNAYGYAVFPTVGKGGFGIGAARGRTTVQFPSTREVGFLPPLTRATSLFRVWPSCFQPQ